MRRAQLGRWFGSGLRRLLRDDETTWLVALALLSMLTLLGSYFVPEWWPLTWNVLPLVLAMNVLSMGRLLILDVVVGASLAMSSRAVVLTRLRVASIVVIALTAAIGLWHARRRIRLGVAAVRGDSMLVELRDRLTGPSLLPVLPRGWHSEAAIRSAGGASFAGDLVVATTTQDNRLLEVAVVDVSGKGVGAGTRALLLSGAFGGLLGSVSKSAFLPTANEYLLRQKWSEGFATAVHLALDLETGHYEVRSAGHPPPVQLHAGSGRWTPYWTEGPALGLIPGATYEPYRGALAPGDVLLLYTDGLVETAKRDMTYGIDRLLGEAQRLVTDGFVGGADRLVRSVDSDSDDRALVLLHRR